MAGVEAKTVGAGEDGMRLDRWFKTHYPAAASASWKSSCAPARCGSTAARAKASTRLATGQTVRVPPLATGAAAPGRSDKHAAEADRDFLA